MKLTTTILSFCVAGLCGAWASGQEMLINPNFENGFDNWELGYNKQEFPKLDEPKVIKGKGKVPTMVRVQVPQSTGTYYVQVFQPVPDVLEGRTYNFSIEIRTESSTDKVAMVVNSRKSPWVKYGMGLNRPMTSDWQRFEVQFVAKGVDRSNPPTLRIGIGALKGDVFLRKASLTESPVAGEKLVVKVMSPDEATQKVKAPTSGPLPVSSEALHAAFVKNQNTAANEYRSRVLQLSGTITGVKKAMRPGTFAIELNGGDVQVMVGGNEFGADEFEALTENIKTVRDDLKELEKAAKKKKNAPKISSKEQKALDLRSYPKLRCEGRLAGFRNREVQISPTRNVEVIPGAVSKK